MMKILQWNIRSVRTNTDFLLLMLRDFLPDVVSLNETWLKTGQSFRFSTY